MEKIIELFCDCEKKMKIYIYPYFLPQYESLESFIDIVKNDKEYNWGETYKSWVYFIDRLLKSKMVTDDQNKADLFLVMQWENYFKGLKYNRDLITPLRNAISSDIYKSTNPKRNHIFIYISDNTPIFEKRIPKWIRTELNKRFIRLTHSGRIFNFGEYHSTDSPKLQGPRIFNFNHLEEIVMPCGIPNNELTIHTKKKLNLNERKTEFYYRGDLNPIKELTERKNFLELIKKHTNINDKLSCLYGIHAAGYGIWTARFFNYLQLGIIPVFRSDGVIMPFERFFNYESFSIKLLANQKENDDIIKKLLTIDKTKSNISKILNNIEQIKDFFNWKSTDKYKNPFTLIIIDLFEFVKLNKNEISNISKKSYIAKKQFHNLKNDLPELFNKI